MVGSQESESEMESDSEDELTDMEEVEDGEFRQNGDGSGDRNDIANMVDRPENPPGDNEQFLDSQEAVEAHGSLSDSDVQVPRSLHGDGTKVAHGDGINVAVNGHVEILKNKLNEGPNKTISVESGPSADPNNNGPVIGPNLGKRNREDRSPPSIGSTQGPTQRIFLQSNMPTVEPLDLNTPARENSGNTAGNVGEISGNPPIGHPVAAVTPDLGFIPRDCASEDFVGDNTSGEAPRNELAEEVEATISKLRG
ncbi:hypothetical protein Hanom_Chr11g01052361 [Helianthus anomalus]